MAQLAGFASELFIAGSYNTARASFRGDLLSPYPGRRRSAVKVRTAEDAQHPDASDVAIHVQLSPGQGVGLATG